MHPSPLSIGPLPSIRACVDMIDVLLVQFKASLKRNPAADMCVTIRSGGDRTVDTYSVTVRASDEADARSAQDAKWLVQAGTDTLATPTR